MNQHAMKYVSMAERLRGEIAPQDSDLEKMLALVADELLEAEMALVGAYGHWRDVMVAAANAGYKRAEDYLAKTQWDLT